MVYFSVISSSINAQEKSTRFCTQRRSPPEIGLTLFPLRENGDKRQTVAGSLRPPENHGSIMYDCIYDLMFFLATLSASHF